MWTVHNDTVRPSEQLSSIAALLEPPPPLHVTLDTLDLSEAARRSGMITFAMGISFLIVLSVIPINFPEPLVRLFLDESDPGFESVLQLTSRLLILAGFFQVFDGLQVIASMALRGLKDTLVPLWLATVGYWVFGIAGGWILAFPMGLETDGLWWGMTAGLTVTGTLLTIRFYMLTRAKKVIT